MKAVTSGEFLNEFTLYADRANEENETFVIQRENGKHLVMMSLDDFNALQKSSILQRRSPIMIDATKKRRPASHRPSFLFARSASMNARSSSVRSAFSSRSGRRSKVMRNDSRRRQAAIFAWSPENSISGTHLP